MKQQLILRLILSLIAFLLYNPATHTNAQPTLWEKYCAPTNVVPGSKTAYDANFGSALSDITTQAGQGMLEGVTAYGADNTAEYAQALFYCRGNESDTATCQGCVADAQVQLAACTTRTEAVVWYQECTVRVANHDMRGVVETMPSYLIWSLQTYPFDDSTILDQEKSIASDVVAKASEDPHGFAINSVDVTSDTTFWFAAQCSPDLVAAPGGAQICIDCLQNIFDAVEGGKSGALPNTQLLGGLTPSCQLLFGLVPINQPLPTLTDPNVSNDLAPSPSPSSV